MDTNALPGDWLAISVTSIVAVAFIAVSVPLMRGRVEPNRFYGFRTKKTFSDERIWYLANRIMGRDMFTYGMITLAFNAAFVTTWHFIPSLPIALVLLVSFGSFSAALAQGFWALRKM
jgi:uncharacterized membrane protein